MITILFFFLKIAQSCTTLSNLPLHAVEYEERINMEALQQSDAYTIFLEDMVMDEVVTPCNAIVSLDASLVNVGDYIELCSAYDQVSANK